MLFPPIASALPILFLVPSVLAQPAQDASARAANPAVEQARAQLRAGKAPEALAVLERALSASPLAEDLHLLRLRILLPGEAGLPLTSALDQYVDCLAKAGQGPSPAALGPSVRAACAADRLAPDGAEVVDLLAAARTARTSGAPQRMLVPLLALARHFGDDPRVLWGLGEAQGVGCAATFDGEQASKKLDRLAPMLEGDTADATAAALEAFLAVDVPGDAVGLLRTVDLYRSCLRHNRPFEISTGLDVDVAGTLERARRARQRGEQAEYVECAKKLKQANPNDPVPDLMLGEVYASLGQQKTSLALTSLDLFLRRTKGASGDDWRVAETLAELGFPDDEQRLGDLTDAVLEWRGAIGKGQELLRVPDAGKLRAKVSTLEKRLERSQKDLERERAAVTRHEEKKKAAEAERVRLRDQMRSNPRAVNLREREQIALDNRNQAQRAIDYSKLRIATLEKESQQHGEVLRAAKARLDDMQ